MMRFLQSAWFPVCLGIILMVALLSSLIKPQHAEPIIMSANDAYREDEAWIPPSENDIPFNEEGDLIRYGKELIVHTANYLGPKGIKASLTNGMNCQNCHLDAGGRAGANPFSSVSSTYPKYRDRSGRVESIEFRVNDCMQRSLHGKTLDSNSLEMRAFVAYLKWIGKDVPKGVRPKGTGATPPPFLQRAADPQKGRLVYLKNCQRCHGQNGEGTMNADSVSFTYPPLWGERSFNNSAGLFLLSRMAGFIYFNMPFDKQTPEPVLSDEDCWDVAAFIVSQPRPEKKFPGDWPNMAKKPADFPFGPYADSFTEQQHKYGPFLPMKK
jgi:thiosulfate dehydrogenase